MDDLLTTKEAAGALGVSPRRIQQLIGDGILKVRKRFGRAPAFARADVEAARNRPKPGRPIEKVA